MPLIDHTNQWLRGSNMFAKQFVHSTDRKQIDAAYIAIATKLCGEKLCLRMFELNQLIQDTDSDNWLLVDCAYIYSMNFFFITLSTQSLIAIGT